MLTGGPALATPLLLASGALLVVAALTAVARRLVPDTPERPHQDAAAAIFNMIGVLYAVVLAFVVIAVWENNTRARDDSQAEANAVSRIYFTARAMPEPQRSELMTLAQEYAATVAHEEWPLMAVGQTSAQARRQVAAMRVTTHELRPTTGDQEILMAHTLDAINTLVDARRVRTAALTAPVTPVMWLGLLVTSTLTVGFTLLFTQPRFRIQLLMVGAAAVLVTFMLWLIHDLSLPFAGANAAGPDPFLVILMRFEEFPP